MKISDIDNQQIYEAILSHHQAYPTQTLGATLQYILTFLSPLPKHLIIAKLRHMIKHSLISGCACGCRGDFNIKS